MRMSITELKRNIKSLKKAKVSDAKALKEEANSLKNFLSKEAPVPPVIDKLSKLNISDLTATGKAMKALFNLVDEIFPVPPDQATADAVLKEAEEMLALPEKAAARGEEISIEKEKVREPAEPIEPTSELASDYYDPYADLPPVRQIPGGTTVSPDTLAGKISTSLILKRVILES